MPSHIKATRVNGLPDALRRELIEARRSRGWSQLELGRRVGLPQAHISGIETGKIVPRFDTLLDLVRVLDRDLILVPMVLVPPVQALIRSHRNPGSGEGEQALYAAGDDDADDSAGY